MRKLTAPLHQLLLYRSLLNDPLIQSFCEFTADNQQNLPFALLHDLINMAERLGLSGNLLQAYIIYLMAIDENPLSITAEKTGGQIGPSLYEAAVHDVAILRTFLTQDAAYFTQTPSLISDYQPTGAATKHYLENLTPVLLSGAETSHDQVVAKLLEHYVSYGYGELVNHTAFRWHKEHGLQGIAQCDPITLDDLVGYQRQKTALIHNTEAFLRGKPAANVLLVGDRGTGKSSSVKALANHYFLQGLRLVEIAKHDLPYFHDILAVLQHKGKKFIIFLDDLSFEEFEIEYKYLKSVMEGGIAVKPSNVLIYATSNRRHLIRESWNDRSDSSDELHRFDTVNEKISLSDRFGLTLTYISPSQEEYLRIIEELSAKNNVAWPLDKLKGEALQWERAHAGRSGRTAQQFIMHVLGNAQ